MDFNWDPKKAKVNLDKHAVSFEEASSFMIHLQNSDMTPITENKKIGIF